MLRLTNSRLLRHALVSSAALLPMTLSAAITYVDATVSNTTLADGSALVQGGNYTVGTADPAADGRWGLRTGVANFDSVFVAPAAATHVDVPTLVTSVSNLTPGTTYSVYAFFWVAGYNATATTTDATTSPTGNNQWDAAFSLTNSNLISYTWNGATGSTAGTRVTGSGLDLTGFDAALDAPGAGQAAENNRRLFAASLGQAVVDPSGRLSVYIDNSAATLNRTWYDGIGYGPVAVPEPTTLSLGALAAMACLRRRRRQDPL